MNSGQKLIEYQAAKDNGDVDNAAVLWREFLSLVESEMLAKSREHYDAVLMHKAG